VIPPEANPHLYGHEAAERTMIRAWESSRLPPAWLLRGPPGVGKATLAYRFARRLLAGADHERAANEPGHAIFRMVVNRAHPDLRILKRELNPKTGKLRRDIAVEQVRDTEIALHETAARDGWKVLIVDLADELNPNGANALLKLLEESPPSTVMLLVCQRPGVLPRTILSRCMQLALTPLPTIELLAALVVLAPELPADRRAVLAELAEGSPGRALELEVVDRPGRYTALLPKLAQARTSVATRLDLATDLAKGGDGRGFRSAADLLATTVRRIATYKAGRVPQLELFPGEQALLEELAAGLGLDRWVAVWDKLSAFSVQVDRLNLDPVQALLQVVAAIGGSVPEPELSLV
jgi:DNA polymerase III subunit delta'